MTSQVTIVDAATLWISRLAPTARSFALLSNAPKSYTVTYELPNGTIKHKSRLKGIKTNGSRLFVDEKSELDHLKRGRDVAFDDSTDTEDSPTPTKKARIDSLQQSETVRRIDLFDQSTTSYSKSSEATHNTQCMRRSQLMTSFCAHAAKARSRTLDSSPVPRDGRRSKRRKQVTGSLRLYSGQRAARCLRRHSNAAQALDR